MPAKKKHPVKVGRPVAKRSSQEASVAEEAAEQDQQEETRSPSPWQAQASVPPTATAAKKKKSLVLSDEQEMELGDWLKENPMLYTKTMKVYKDMAKKIHLWNSKAAELDVESGSVLKT